VLRLPFGTLAGWNLEFDEQLKPYVVVDKRGKSGKVTIEIVRQVVDKARDFKARNKRLRIKMFARQLNKELQLNLSRTTIQQILIANDLWKPETRRKRPKFYQNLCQRIPNGLVSLDGSELVVWINDDAIKFNVELGVDVGSFCHTGVGIDPTETAEAVIQVLEAHRRRWGVPLGVVFDHGSANLSDKVSEYLQAHAIEPVPAGPGNPKGNGTDEGAFSQMKKTVGTIRLNNSSPQALAKSVLVLILSVYVKMRNQMALRKNSMVPITQMQAPVTDTQRQTERERLAAHNHAKNIEDTNEPKRARLYWIIKYHGLTPEPPVLDRAEYCIRYYDIEAIAKSEEAFLKAVNRDANRRSLPYFFGILRNIQHEMDNEHYQLYCRQRYNHGLMLENEKRQQQQQKEQASPTIEHIVEMAANAVTQSVRFVKELAERKSRQWTQELLRSVRYIGPLKKKIIDAIGTLSHLDENQKEQTWKLIEQFLNHKPEVESVTLIR
jgi:hypothetical protein